MRLAYGASFLGLALALTLGMASGDERTIEKARAGQWVLHADAAVVGTTSNTTYKYTYQWVERVDEHKVHVMTQSIRSDRKTAITAADETVVDLAPKAKDDLLAEEEITLNGRAFRCQKRETVTKDPVAGDLTTIVWTSPDVPIYGTVKAVRLDKEGRELARTTLVDFGETGGAEKPMGSGDKVTR